MSDIKINTSHQLPIQGNRLRECRECRHSIDGCTYCLKIQKHIFPYQYGCQHFETDKEYEKRLIQQEKERLAKEEIKANHILTAMCISATATQSFLEDFATYFEDREDKSNWRFSRKQAAKKITESLESARTNFAHYFQADMNKTFSDKGKKEFNDKAYDRHQEDANEICRLMMLYMDRCWADPKSANEIIAHLESMPSKGFFDTKSIEHYRVKGLNEDYESKD